MDFVNNVNLEPTMAGHIFDIFPKLTDLINAPIGCAINFKHVQCNAFGNFLARLADTTWRRSGTMLTVHGLGRNSCHRRLTNTPGASKQKGMDDSIRPDSISQRIRDVILAHDLFEGLGSVFSCKYQIRHGAYALAL
jgi:hypothetical protein